MTLLKSRSILLVLLTVWQGASTVVGPALHASPAAASRLKLGDAVVSSDPDLDSSNHEHCPVCQFLSMAQAPTERIVFSSPAPSVSHDSPAHDSIRPFIANRPGSPRAPPRARLNLS